MQENLLYWKSFIDYVVSRFRTDKCSSVAAELTFTSLLALVPLTTVVFSLLALVPDFQSMAGQLQTMMFEYFVPATGESVQGYLTEFVGKAKSMSGVGFIMLVVTALLMMRTIDRSFNNIWQIKSKKSILRTFLVYWAILTLGPILLGTSLVISSYLKSLPLLSNVVQQSSSWATVGLPMIMETITFALMFFVIPDRKVLFKHALIASSICAVFFEFAKSGFGIFVEYISTYQVIFGALATIPLFMIWIYLSWSIVLFGAEICHGLFAFQVNQREEQSHPFIQLIRILILLHEKQRIGKTISEENIEFNEDWGGKEAAVFWLEKLIDFGVVAKLQDQSYCLKLNGEDINYQLVYEVASNQIPNRLQVQASDLPAAIQSEIVDLSSKLQLLLARRLIDYSEKNKADS